MHSAPHTSNHATLSPAQRTRLPACGAGAKHLAACWGMAAALILLAGGAVRAAETTNYLTESRSTLEKWVETRQLISKTRTDWQSDKETLQQTVQLFERELEKVQNDLGKLSTNSTEVDKQRQQAETSLKASEESLEKTKQFAIQFEAQLAPLIPRLPSPLQDILKPSLNRLPANATNTTLGAPERVLVLVTILGELEKFNHAVTIFNEKRKNSRGEEVSVETVYLGLGAAYFVSDSGELAGMGAPGGQGWEWTNQPELASRIREVIRIYKNERPARFIPLPVVIR